MKWLRLDRLATAGSIIASTTLLASCGGGSGGAAPSSTAASTALTYSSSATVGELLDYTVDTTKMTYNYTITESQYGLTGATGSGTLASNTDGTYSMSGISGARLVVLPNGLLLAAVHVSINGVGRTIPVIGIHSPVSTLASAAGAYNFVQRSCQAGSCVSAYGTFKLNSDSTWSSCAGGDISVATPSCTFQASGTANSLGNGKWQVMQGGVNMGTVLAFNSAGQNVMIMDLKDTRTTNGFGVGMLIGSTEQAVSSTQTDGTWVALGTDGSLTEFTASGSMMNFSMGTMMGSSTGTMSMNSPWNGFVTPSVSGVVGGEALMAGSGVYVYEGSGFAQVGMKIH